MALRAQPFHAGDLLRIRGERWRVTRWTPYDDGALLEVSGQDAANRGCAGHFLLPFEPVDRVAATPAPRVVRPTEWRRVARAILAEATPAWRALRAPLRAEMTIAPFQLEPALAILGGCCRVLIADEVGLGKTVQAGLIVAELLARDPAARAVVVCPAGLRDQWHDELRRRFGLAPVVLDAAGVAQVASLYDADVNPWATERVVLTSIDYLKRPEVMRSLEALLWDVAVFDEAHGLGGASDRATAAALLGSRSRRIVLLTATPHSGDDEGFRRMCGIGALGDGAPLVFRRTRAEAGIGGRRRSMLLRVRPSPGEEALQRALTSYARKVRASERGGTAALAMSVLARRASSSAASLARSLERRLDLLDVPGGPSQLGLPFLDTTVSDQEPDWVLAAPGLDDRAEERRLLAGLREMALRAVPEERKVAALTRLLRRCRQPAIVFTEYRDTLAHLAERLPWPAVQLHGAMPWRARREATRAFTDGRAPLLLATDAASEGLNLHARCRLVISLELPWTPVRLEQRIGRVDRIGQRHTVHAITLVGSGRSEAASVRRFASRAERAHEALRVTAGPGVSAAATAEAARLAVARALLPPAATWAGARPLACQMRRRSMRAAANLSVWRVAFVGDDDCILWEWVCGTHGDASSGEMIDADRRGDSLLGELRPALAALAAREHAIVAALRLRHARLAATLLQPGLFDHRAGRAAAAQAALLDDALAPSGARLRALDAASHARPEQPRLLFTIRWR